MCPFCNIIAGEVKSPVIYEDNDCLAIDDINPQAPVHFLVIPKKHLSTLLDADEKLMGRLLFIARQLAEKKGIAHNGFRTVINCNKHGGQTVYHLHIHVLGGRWFTWPPG